MFGTTAPGYAVLLGVLALAQPGRRARHQRRDLRGGARGRRRGVLRPSASATNRRSPVSSRRSCSSSTRSRWRASAARWCRRRRSHSGRRRGLARASRRGRRVRRRGDDPAARTGSSSSPWRSAGRHLRTGARPVAHRRPRRARRRAVVRRAVAVLRHAAARDARRQAGAAGERCLARLRHRPRALGCWPSRPTTRRSRCRARTAASRPFLVLAVERPARAAVATRVAGASPPGRSSPCIAFRQLRLPFYHWYVVPPLVLLAIGAGLACDVAARSIARRRRRTPGRPRCRSGRRRTLVAAVVVAIVLVVSACAAVDHRLRHAPLVSRSRSSSAYIAIGRWLAANTPPDARVGYIEVGFIGYYSRRPSSIRSGW